MGKLRICGLFFEIAACISGWACILKGPRESRSQESFCFHLDAGGTFREVFEFAPNRSGAEFNWDNCGIAPLESIAPAARTAVTSGAVEPCPNSAGEKSGFTPPGQQSARALIDVGPVHCVDQRGEGFEFGTSGRNSLSRGGPVESPAQSCLEISACFVKVVVQ